MFPPALARLVTVSVGGAAVVTACAAPAAAERRETSPAASGPRAPAEAVPVTRRLVTDADRAMGIEWRFDVGSTIHAPPAVAADGSIYVGTGDGYFLSIASNGVLGWSYTLEGAVAWSPVIDLGGRVVYVATTAQRLAAFEASGAKAWQASTPAHVASELEAAIPSGVLFAGTDGNVWAYSEHGSALWHAPLGSLVSAGPRAAGHRYVVATNAGDALEYEGVMRRGAVHLDAPCEAIVDARADGSFTVLSGGALLDVDARGETRFRRTGVVSAATAPGGYLTIEVDGALVRLDLDGRPLARTPLAGETAGPPSATASGIVYVPGASGRLAVVNAKGVVRWIPIASSALHRPVFDVPGHRVIVAAGNGIVASLREED